MLSFIAYLFNLSSLSLSGLPAGSGIFVVCDATNGAPLGIFQENRYLTDLRTGAAGDNLLQMMMMTVKTIMVIVMKMLLIIRINRLWVHDDRASANDFYVALK